MIENLHLLRLLHDDVKAWATPLGGKVSAAGTFVESLDILATGPSGFVCIIEWQGEETVSEDSSDGIVSQNIGIYVSVNAGMAAKPGAVLWLSPEGRTLLERCNQVRDRVREIELPDDEETSRCFNYKGSRQVLLPDGTPLKAYRLEFSITNAVRDPIYRTVAS